MGNGGARSSDLSDRSDLSNSSDPTDPSDGKRGLVRGSIYNYITFLWQEKKIYYKPVAVNKDHSKMEHASTAAQQRRKR